MAFPNDMSRLVEGVANPEGSTTKYSTATAHKKAARNLIRKTYTLVKPAADAMAADTTAYTAAFQIRMKNAGRVLGAYLQPQSTLTAHASNNCSVNVVKGDGAAGAAVVMATYTSDVAGGNLAAGVTKALTVSATVADTRFATGSVLGFNITKASLGVVVPILSIQVDVEEEDVDAYGI